MTHPHTLLPSLEYPRKQARALLKALAAGDPQALARFQKRLPRFAGATLESLRAASRNR